MTNRAQLVYGPYPMTIQQMSDWAKTVSSFTPNEVAKALHVLSSGVTIRKI